LTLYLKIGGFEANPLTANGYYKAQLNKLLKENGSTPYRTNSFQEGLNIYDGFVIGEKACEGYANNSGEVIATLKDTFLDIDFPKLNWVKCLSPEVLRCFQVREYSWAEIAMKARLAKVVELAYEKGITHAITNHTGGFSGLFQVFRDTFGVPNFFAGKPAHH
jgi:hypothetical protein